MTAPFLTVLSLFTAPVIIVLAIFTTDHHYPYMSSRCSVRPLCGQDIPLLADYWLLSEPDFMVSMGVDLAKLPERGTLEAMLAAQLQQDYPDKQSYCIIWEQDGKAIGHSNVNKILYGAEASMHLHLWQPNSRQKGMGLQLVLLTLPFFFRNLALQHLYCEPYALNPAPNKTLAKAGFTLEREYVTTPGYLNFEQPVKRWVMSREQFLLLP